MNSIKQDQYKLKDQVHFFYYYEDKVGEVTGISESKRYTIKSNGLFYTVPIDKIHGKINNDEKSK